MRRIAVVPRSCKQRGVIRKEKCPRALLRRLAAVTVEAEIFEGRMVNGEKVDITALCQLASTVVRLSQRLGVSHKAAKAPNLTEYLARLMRHLRGPDVVAVVSLSDRKNSATRFRFSLSVA
jgi:hypothetical protein